MAAVRAGVGRETAHELIREHAVAVALAMREEGTPNDLIERLASDSRLQVTRAQLERTLAEPLSFTGVSDAQVDAVVDAVRQVLAQDPDAGSYRPGEIL